MRTNKRKRKENKKSSATKKKELSGCVLPLPGENTVAAEAYHKLSESDKQIVVTRLIGKPKRYFCWHVQLQKLLILSYVFMEIGRTRISEITDI